VAVTANGRSVGRLPVKAATTFRVHLDLAPGPYDIRVVIHGAAGVIATRESKGVRLLPASAGATAPPRPRLDPALNRRLAQAGRSFRGNAAVLSYDMATGRAGGWNTDARFPAASAVKLGVLLAAVQWMGTSPERSRAMYDVSAVGAWSSNLATNRLLRVMGGGSEAEGTRLANEGLRTLGARRSTFTGSYLVGTAYSPSGGLDVVSEPPSVSRRLTTARDMAEMLTRVHRAATGAPSELRRLRLTRHQARVLLATLVGSQSLADNRGLLRAALGPTVPIAQKHGWISSARHTGAIVYTEAGPRVLVVLTYRPGLTLAAGEAFARRVLTASSFTP
jgi:beta-lactamase class A